MPVSYIFRPSLMLVPSPDIHLGPVGATRMACPEAVMNQENHSYMTQLRRTGWDYVPVDRHPEMMPETGKHTIIERKGMVLMLGGLAIGVTETTIGGYIDAHVIYGFKDIVAFVVILVVLMIRPT
mgnify:CR=1 FL=1